MIEIVQARTKEDFDIAADLMREFVAWLRVRYQDDPSLVTNYFDKTEWQNELDSLGEKYVEPYGALLLATYSGKAFGCFAMRYINDDTCEGKRLFVLSTSQGQGVGRKLVQSMIVLAASKGYQRMCLDTGYLQREAIALYESLGFGRIPAYYSVSPQLSDLLIFMERDLTQVSIPSDQLLAG